MSQRLTSIALSILLSATALTVSAQPSGSDQRARLHFQAGSSYFDTGDYEEALREFQRAYQLSHRAALFYNFSLVYERLGDLRNASQFLQRYLAETENIRDRATHEQRLANMQRRLARMGQTTTDTTTTDTTTTDTTTTDTTTTDTTTTDTTTTDTTTTDTTTTDATTTDTTTTDATTTDTTTTDTTTTDTTTTDTDPEEGGGVSGLAITGFIGAGVGAVMFGVFGALTLAEDASLKDGCGVDQRCTDEDVSGLNTLAAIADVGWVLALVGAGIGVIGLLVGGDDDESESAAFTVAPWVHAESAGVAAAGRF